MTKILKPLFIFYLLLFWVPFLSSQNATGILKGSVFENDSKERLPGANIQLAKNLIKGTTSDVNGNYILELDTGIQKLICSYVGLKSYTLYVHITENVVIEQDIYLKSSTKSLETVVVTTGKFDQRIEDVTVSMEVLKPQLITNKNTTSIETALEQVPGLSIIDNDPQIRGGSGFTFGVGSRVQILQDGIPLLSGDAGRPEWNYIPVENLEQVEVIKGVSSVLYGSSALNGVINVRTAYPRSKPKTAITISSGAYNLPNSPVNQKDWWYNNKLPGVTNVNFFHSRIIKNNLDFVIGGNFNVDQGYVLAPPPAIYLPWDIKQAFNITSKDSIYTFNRNDMLKIRGRINFNLRYRSTIEGLNYGVNGNAMYNKTNMVLAWLNDSANINQGYPGAVFLENQKMFNLDPFIKYTTHNGISHSLIGRLFHTDNQISNNQSNNGTNYFAEYQLQRVFKGLGLTFTGGLVNNISTSTSNMYASSGTPNNVIQNRSAYIQLDYKLWKIITLSGGFRYEAFKMNLQPYNTAPILRGGANIQVLEHTFVRLSGGQGYRFPTITERYITTKAGMFAVFPNPGLVPETSEGYEIGIKQGFKIGSLMGYIDGAAFNQTYKNTIEFLFGEWDPSIAVAGFKFVNTGNSKSSGLDFSISAITPETNKRFGVTMLLGYTYVNPISTTPNYVYAKYVPIAGDPNNPTQLSYNSTSMNTSGNVMKYRYKHMIKADVEFNFYKKIFFGVSYRYYSKMQNIDTAFANLETFTTSNPFFYPIHATSFWNSHNGFHIFDARLAYKISTKQKIAIICSNVFNVTYMLRPMKLEPPRLTMVQYTFEI
ncbi:MAG: TonB-dependent receptor [Bacteroidetes bacterium]|nr:TonB-dependent receptor [Bacteroidota bacterium]